MSIPHHGVENEFDGPFERQWQLKSLHTQVVSAYIYIYISIHMSVSLQICTYTSICIHGESAYILQVPLHLRTLP